MKTKKIFSPDAPRSTVFIRLMVGTIFFSEGIQRLFLTHSHAIGNFPMFDIHYHEYIVAFIGSIEMILGFFIIIGFATRFSAFLLLIDILITIMITKMYLLFKNGFWLLFHDSYLVFCMLLGLLFLCFVGPGKISIAVFKEKQ